MFKIGFDAVTISRIEKSIKSKSFLKRQFSEKEIILFDKRNMRTEVIAANFAVKEAFSKAMGCGIFGFDSKEISVLRRESGEPYLEFTGELEQKMLAGEMSAEVSISHENDMAFGMVLLQKNK